MYVLREKIGNNVESCFVSRTELLLITEPLPSNDRLAVLLSALFRLSDVMSYVYMVL
jgi:hypothetical protein